MIVGVVKERGPRETRVAATPTSVGQLSGLGYAVVVEPGAGSMSSFSDKAYVEAGAEIGSVAQAEIVLAVNAPTPVQLDQMRPGAVLIAMLSPALRPDLLEELRSRTLTALAVDAVARISRAQSMDVLSSMANIAGYRAVIEAAHAFGRFFTGQVTAAGKVPPAKVLVVGAGVAGLAAVGTAGSLGAVVRATDPRPEVADQVRSLGGEYLAVGSTSQEVSSSGYASEMDQQYQRAEADALCRAVPRGRHHHHHSPHPGRPAPRVITADMVSSMRPGSVIVDMAAGNGGNVEGAVADQVVGTDNGVTIIGFTDLPGRLAAQASQLYATNVVNLLKLLTPARDGTLVLDLDDVVQRSVTVVHRGAVTWPPPRTSVTAAPAGPPPAAPVPAKSAPRPAASPGRRLAAVLGSAAAVFFLVAISPAGLQVHLTVFALAIVIGYYVIGHVHHALHTPLMSVTNAISGIIVVGAVLQIGQGDAAVTALASVAILLASINVFGGFAVTRRMLAMFTRS